MVFKTLFSATDGQGKSYDFNEKSEKRRGISSGEPCTSHVLAFS